MDGSIKHSVEHSDTDSQQALDQLIANFVHDAGASVRAISELPKWIVEDIDAAGILLPEDVSETFSMLLRQTARFERMMHDLGTYAQVGQRQPATHIDLSLALKAVLSQHDQTSKLTIRNTVSPCMVYISEKDLKTLFEALISNAEKHHDSSEGTLEISSHQLADRVTISFADDGPGIAEQHHAQIFELMKTLKSKDQVPGSGLGLAIVRKICGLYGGSICVQSTPPARGSSFDLTFPISQPH